jgi:DNA-binding NarL/FixJ family response regulator
MAWTALIVDDHPGFRAHARSLLEEEGLEVVGDAATGEDAVEAVAALRPDVVLLDICLPGIDGLEVARRLAARGDRAAVVLTSSQAREDFAGLIGESGARGFVPKDALSGRALRELLA